MKHEFLDQYSDRDSPIHRLDPRTKLITSLALVTAVVLTPPDRWFAYAVYFFVLAALVVISKVPIGYIIKRSLLIMPFVLMIAIFIPFFKEGEVAGSYNIWMWQLSVTHSGLEVLRNIVIKAWLSVVSLTILSATTRMPDLLKGLERLKVPKIIVMILSFMYRYIFLVVDEAMRMKQARDSRNFGGKRLWQIKTVGRMIASLFIRSYERGERVYAAMTARGFDGHGRSLKVLNFRPADAYFGLSLGLVLLTTGVFSLIL